MWELQESLRGGCKEDASCSQLLFALKGEKEKSDQCRTTEFLNFWCLVSDLVISIPWFFFLFFSYSNLYLLVCFMSLSCYMAKFNQAWAAFPMPLKFCGILVHDESATTRHPSPLPKCCLCFNVMLTVLYCLIFRWNVGTQCSMSPCNELPVLPWWKTSTPAELKPTKTMKPPVFTSVQL